MGAATHFNYELNSIPNSKRTLTIYKPVVDSVIVVDTTDIDEEDLVAQLESQSRDYQYYLKWFYEDYGIVAWVSNDKYVHLTLYEWKGYWKSTFLKEIYVDNWVEFNYEDPKQYVPIYLHTPTETINLTDPIEYDVHYSQLFGYKPLPPHKVVDTQSFWTIKRLQNYLQDNPDAYVTIENNVIYSDDLKNYNIYEYEEVTEETSNDHTTSYHYVFQQDYERFTDYYPDIWNSIVTSGGYYSSTTTYSIGLKAVYHRLTGVDRAYFSCEKSDLDDSEVRIAFTRSRPSVNDKYTYYSYHYSPDLNVQLNRDFFTITVNQNIYELVENPDTYSLVYHRETDSPDWNCLTFGRGAASVIGEDDFDIDLGYYQVGNQVECGDDYFVIVNLGTQRHLRYVWDKVSSSWQSSAINTDGQCYTNIITHPNYYVMVRDYTSNRDDDYHPGFDLYVKNELSEFIEMNVRGITSTDDTGGSSIHSTDDVNINNPFTQDEDLSYQNCLEYSVTPGPNFIVCTGKFMVDRGNFKTFQQIFEWEEVGDSIQLLPHLNEPITDFTGSAYVNISQDYVSTLVYKDYGFYNTYQDNILNRVNDDSRCAILNLSSFMGENMTLGHFMLTRPVISGVTPDMNFLSFLYSGHGDENNEFFRYATKIEPDAENIFADFSIDLGNTYLQKRANIAPQIFSEYIIKNNIRNVNYGSHFGLSDFNRLNDGKFDLNFVNDCGDIISARRDFFWERTDNLPFTSEDSLFIRRAQAYSYSMMDEFIPKMNFTKSIIGSNYFLLDDDNPLTTPQIGFIRNGDIVRHVKDSGSSREFAWHLQDVSPELDIFDVSGNYIFLEKFNTNRTDSLQIYRVSNINAPDIIVQDSTISENPLDISVSSLYFYNDSRDTEPFMVINYEYKTETALMSYNGSTAQYAEVTQRINDNLGYTKTYYCNDVDNIAFNSYQESNNCVNAMFGKVLRTEAADSTGNIFSTNTNFYKYMSDSLNTAIKLKETINVTDNFEKRTLFNYIESNGRVRSVKTVQDGYSDKEVITIYWDDLFGKEKLYLNDKSVFEIQKIDDEVVSAKYNIWEEEDEEWVIKASYAYTGPRTANISIPVIPEGYPDVYNNWQRTALILEYDDNLQVKSQIGTNDIKTVNYKNTIEDVLLYTASNCDASEALAESFEYYESLVLNSQDFNYSSPNYYCTLNGTAKTGNTSMIVSEDPNYFKMLLKEGRTYKLSYWEKKRDSNSTGDISIQLKNLYSNQNVDLFQSQPSSVGEWELKTFYFTHTLGQTGFTDPSDVLFEIKLTNSATGSTQLIDDLRISPVDATLTSFTYNPTKSRITSTTDNNNNIVYQIYNYLDEKAYTLDTDYISYQSTNIFFNQTKDFSITYPSSSYEQIYSNTDFRKNVGLSASTLDKGFFESFEYDSWEDNWSVTGQGLFRDNIHNEIKSLNSDSFTITRSNFDASGKDLIFEFDAKILSNFITLNICGVQQSVAASTNSGIEWGLPGSSEVFSIDLPADQWHHYMFVLRKGDSSSTHDKLALYVDGVCLNMNMLVPVASYTSSDISFGSLGNGNTLDNISVFVNPELKFSYLSGLTKEEQQVVFNFKDESKHLLKKLRYDENGIAIEEYPMISTDKFTGGFVVDSVVDQEYSTFFSTSNYSTMYEYEKSPRKRYSEL